MANNIIRGLVIGLVIFAIGFLAINYYVKREKLSQAKQYIKTLDNIIKQKDEAIKVLGAQVNAKQAELVNINKVLDNVKRELEGIRSEVVKKDVKAPRVELKK